MAVPFVRRTSAPSETNLYYVKTTKGGWNKCIQIKSNGFVLPNCTGYAWGRFMECQPNVHTCNLSRANAELWYPNTMDGYQRGQTPKLGAVICWHSTRSGGHVAIVERIYDDGSIQTTNSAYKGTLFYTKKLNPPNYFMGKSYTFQGFIYNPTEFIPDPTPPTPTPTTQTKSRFPWVLYARKLRDNRN